MADFSNIVEVTPVAEVSAVADVGTPTVVSAAPVGVSVGIPDDEVGGADVEGSPSAEPRKRAEEDRNFVASALATTSRRRKTKAKPMTDETGAASGPGPDIVPPPKRRLVEVAVSTSSGRPEFPDPVAEVLVSYLLPKRMSNLSRLGTHHGKRIQDWSRELRNRNRAFVASLLDRVFKVLAPEQADELKQVVIPYYCRKRHIDPTNEQDVHPALDFLSTVAASHPQSSAERRVALAALAKFKVKDAATALQNKSKRYKSRHWLRTAAKDSAALVSGQPLQATKFSRKRYNIAVLHNLVDFVVREPYVEKMEPLAGLPSHRHIFIDGEKFKVPKVRRIKTAKEMFADWQASLDEELAQHVISRTQFYKITSAIVPREPSYEVHLDGLAPVAVGAAGARVGGETDASAPSQREPAQVDMLSAAVRYGIQALQRFGK